MPAFAENHDTDRFLTARQARPLSAACACLLLAPMHVGAQRRPTWRPASAWGPRPRHPLPPKLLLLLRNAAQIAGTACPPTATRWPSCCWANPSLSCEPAAPALLARWEEVQRPRLLLLSCEPPPSRCALHCMPPQASHCASLCVPLRSALPPPSPRPGPLSQLLWFGAGDGAQPHRPL